VIQIKVEREEVVQQLQTKEDQEEGKEKSAVESPQVVFV
jgi:sRNA-binding carbon storage regulator CsrA